jgi:uncharacterized protein (DUF362 family)
MPRIYIDSLSAGYDDVLARGFEFLKPSITIRPGDRITLKPNLTFPRFRPGVMTTPEAVEAVVRHLTNYTNRISICESDSGGYNRFSMTEVFAATGLDAIARRYGARIVNLSYEPSRPITARTRLASRSIPMPILVLDETDLFVTIPVPKVHANAVISVAVKNQWGIIQDPALRLKLHPSFKEVIYAVNKALPRSMAIVDGRYGLTRSGPLQGDAVACNWALLSDDLFYTDAVVAGLMGFDLRRIPYLKYACDREGITSVDSILFNQDHGRFRSDAFYLQRVWTDYPGVLTFNSRTLAYVGYESPLCRPLHWLLYRFRQPFY